MSLPISGVYGLGEESGRHVRLLRLRSRHPRLGAVCGERWVSRLSLNVVYRRERVCLLYPLCFPPAQGCAFAPVSAPSLCFFGGGRGAVPKIMHGHGL